MDIIIFIVILLVLILSHEFGHFIVAKKAGIRVDEFAFGFKPKIFGIKRGETTYSLNALPIGGYVKIFGENPDEESISGLDSARSFVNKPKYIQALVLIAGVVMNFLVAWLLISVGFMSGLPSSTSAIPKGSVLTNEAVTIMDVAKDSPAEKAGLKTGDKLISFSTVNDTTEIPSTESVQYFIKKHGGEEITVNFNRGTDLKQVKLIPESKTAKDDPKIGISMDVIGTLKLSFIQALWEGLKLSANLFVVTAVGFYTLIHNALIGQGSMAGIAGPVGIVGIVGDAAKFGFIYLLSLTALISVNLVVINLIPFPALDGGRLLFLLIEKIKGSRIKPKVANIINMIGFGILMLLMIVITYRDIVKLF